MAHRSLLARACWIASGLALLAIVLILPLQAASSPAATTPPSISFALGMSHSCALINGEVRCWGIGQSAGVAGGNDQPVPVTVTGLGSNVQAIAAGIFHSCALLGDGTVRCWGKNGSGQLGNGSSADSQVPVTVSGLAAVRGLAAGYEHTCALLDGGAVKCWGLNADGQLGGGSGVGATSSVPVSVAGLSGAAALAGGGAHTCALMTSGSVKCWGYGFYGSLGNGGTASKNTPVDVTGLAGATQVAAGYLHTCALVSGDGVRCWGQFAELWTTTPVVIAGFGNPTAIAANGGHLCALSTGGGVSCLGENSAGQLGNGSTTNRTAPVPVTGLGSGVTAIAAGPGDTCATLAAGGARCWGGDVWGQLGNGNLTRGIAALGELSGVTYRAISVGNLHICGTTSAGKAHCWGRDYNGELGIGAQQSGTTYGSPQDVVGLSSGVSVVAAGIQYTCAVVNGAARCWGRNDMGQLGNGTRNYASTPVNVSGLDSEVTAIAVSSMAEGTHSCAVAGGAAKCWGDNYLGQLGNGQSGSTTPETMPVNVTGLSAGVSAVVTGGRHSCAAVNGAARCWGYGYYGQLGNGASGSHTPVPTPVVVSGLSGVTALAAGDDFTCAIANGAAKCWGRNDKGQLGDNTWTNRAAPVQVVGLNSGVTSISAWHTQACAVKSGTVYCWGDSVTPSPSSISWAATGYTGVAAGDVRCAWGSAGVTCWGPDIDGKLGDGRVSYRTAPVPVIGLKPGPELLMYHASARPGSLLNVRGANFPAWATVPLHANGRLLGTAQANERGFLNVVIKTGGAPSGFYSLQALANGVPVAASFTLDLGAPLRAAEGTGTVLTLAAPSVATPPPATATPASGQQPQAPQVSKVVPDRGASNAPAQVEVHGANFKPGAVVRMDGIPAASTLYQSSNLLTALLPGAVVPGPYRISVINPDWQQGSLPDAYTAILVQAAAQPVQQDLHGFSYELMSENLTEYAGVPSRVMFTVHRLGGAGSLTNVPVRFYVGTPGLSDPTNQGTYIGQAAAPSLPPNRSSTAWINWTPAAAGALELYAVIDPSGAIAEVDEANNTVHRPVFVEPAPVVDRTPPVVDAVTAPLVTSGSSVVLSVTAHDPPGGSGLQWADFVVWEYFPSLRAWLVTDESGWQPCAPGTTNTYHYSLGYFAGPRFIDVWVADAAKNVSDAPRSVIVNYLKPDDFIFEGDSQLFLFPLNQGQALGANMSVSYPGNDADLYLWPPDYPGRAAWSSINDGTALEQIAMTAPVAGYYWLEVFGYQTSFYNLTVGLAGATDAAGLQSEPGMPLLAKPSRTPVVEVGEMPSHHSSLSRVFGGVYLPMLKR